jgi:hypothetical protein
MHLGEAIYPDNVIRYFKGFLDVVGFGDPLRPGRDGVLLWGNTHADEVRTYFANMSEEAIKRKDLTTYVYHWSLAGMSPDSFLIEAIHNIVAFSQYNNYLYKLISDKLWANTTPAGDGPETTPPGIPTPPGNVQPPLFVYGLSPTGKLPVPAPPAPPTPPVAPPLWYPLSPIPLYAPNVPGIGYVGPVDFFKKVTEAKGNESLQVKLVMESFRLLNTNTNAFSRLKPEREGNPYPTDGPVQSRHIWQEIMIENQSVPAVTPDDKILEYKISKFFKLDTSIYPGDTTFNCPMSPPVQPTDNYNPEDNFTVTTKDDGGIPGNTDDVTESVNQVGDGTVRDALKPDLIPVLDTPIFCPMGLGYRRCAGEIQNYFLGLKLIKKFATLEFYVVPFPDPVGADLLLYETVAPFLAVADNIYAVQNKFTSFTS